MSNDPEPPAIACHLSAAGYQDRVAWIAELNSSALRDYRRDGRRIELTYDASAAERVGEFVRRERLCCPFLDFSLELHKDVVTLQIEAPHDVADAADALFAPYITQGRRAM